MTESSPNSSLDVLPSSRCDLCGLPTGRSKLQLHMEGRLLRFCCPGCLHVFQILFNDPHTGHESYKETKIYKACVEAGLIPRDETDRDRLLEGFSGKNEAGEPMTDIQAGLSRQVSLHLSGMWCVACSWLIEAVVQKLTGVLWVRASFLSDMLDVRFLPHQVSLEDILREVERIGYRARHEPPSSTDSKEKRDVLKRLGIAAILTCNIMLISFVLYWGFFEDLEKDGVSMLAYPLWALSTPVVFFSGLPMLKRSWLGLRHLRPTMDVLISVGALAAYGYSVHEVIRGGIHVYFDTASMLVTLVLLGRFLEAHTKDKLTRGISELYELSSGKIRLLRAAREQWVKSDAATVGDYFTLDPGMRIPMDAVLAEGESVVDESFLTGESRPLRKRPGDEIRGGSLLLEGHPMLRVERSVHEGSLGRMIALTREAMEKKDPFETIADRVIRRLIPLILALAAGTGLWMLHGGEPLERSILRAITVLVITCPCALGIATPLAKVAAIAKGRSLGFLIRDPAALERAHRLDTIILDKTGTLTEGRFTLRHHGTTQAEPLDDLARVASVEQYSDHFLARELVCRAREMGLKLHEVNQFESLDGMGVKGMVADVEIRVGNRVCMSAVGRQISEQLEQEAGRWEAEAHTVVFYGWGENVYGYLAFGDRERDRARALVEDLESRGIELHLISGDSSQTTQTVARKLGLKRCRGSALPQNKVDVVQQLQALGKRVGMVGDGVNDAAALARADVGFAVGASWSILRDASHITLLAGNVERLPAALDLSRLTTTVMKQNLLFALIYNALGIPLAVMGLLNPLVAVLAMFTGSLTVLANTLRISRFAESRA